MAGAEVGDEVRDAFRTRFLHLALAYNELIIKEKGLLFVEQPSQISVKVPDVARSGFEPETSGL